MQTRNRTCFTNCVAAIGVFLLLLAIAVGFLWYHHHRACRFNRSVWILAPIKADSPRYDMVKDLQKRYLHKGMTRPQVYRLIGKPDFNSQNSTRPPNTDSYFLAADVDAWILNVKYDKEGKLIGTEVWQN